MSPPPWPCPAATGPLDAVVAVPGSKSLTNRALLLALLADGPGTLVGALRSRDTALMTGALRALGAEVDDGPDGAAEEPSTWQVRPPGTPLPVDGGVRLDVGNAGTVARFVPGVAALADGPVALDGDPRVRERPLGPLLAALRELGADVDDGGRGALPVVVHGRGGLRGGEVEVDASSSSQLVSALLLLGARTRDGVDVRAAGPVLSAPHLRMTVAELRRRGVDVTVDDEAAPSRWHVAAGPVAAVRTVVEPDLSTAAPFVAAPLAAGGRVVLRGWPAPGTATTQPGAVLPDLLEAFGARVAHRPDGLEVVASGDAPAGGLDLDLSDVGELTPVVAAVAALGSRPTRLRGVAHLRGHETDRLAALERGLRALGADVTQTDDGLVVARGRGPGDGARGVLLHAEDDHRLVMAWAVCGLSVPDLAVDDVATTAKTFPGFADAWAALVAGEPPGAGPGGGTGGAAGPAPAPEGRVDGG